MTWSRQASVERDLIQTIASVRLLLLGISMVTVTAILLLERPERTLEFPVTSKTQDLSFSQALDR